MGSSSAGDATPNPNGPKGTDRENEANAAAVNAGYLVVQNPMLTAERREAAGIDVDKNPDLLVEGKVFDVRSPLSAAGAEEATKMSTTFVLALNVSPGKLFQGMDERSSAICDILHRELKFPTFKPAVRGATAWSSSNAGVLATIWYPSEHLVQALERMSGINGNLFLSLTPTKQLERGTTLINIFATAKQVLRGTQCDAAFIQDAEQLIFRRVRGELLLERKSDPRHETYSDEMLRQLDTSVDAQLLNGAAT